MKVLVLYFGDEVSCPYIVVYSHTCKGCEMCKFQEGNLELVKIPNFLHLTPAAIERHCNAIKSSFAFNIYFLQIYLNTDVLRCNICQ